MRSYAAHERKGFALLELIAVIVILGILTMIAIPKINSLMEQSRENITKQNLTEIKKAIIGDPSIKLRGFRQIVGHRPDNLDELWNVSGASAANPFQNQGQGSTTFVDQKATKDGWGGTLVIGTTTDGDGVLISPGPDGVVDGGGNKNDYNMSSKGDDVVLVLPDQS